MARTGRARCFASKTRSAELDCDSCRSQSPSKWLSPESRPPQTANAGAKRSHPLSQIEEALPFDEPVTEDGQQDGNLRPAWTWAYKQGWDSYEFNDDRYMVFDGAGRPKVPQVCIDFITDTLERASGTWWRGRDGQRERLRGKLDFETLGIENRRSVERFVRFAKAHPEWFDGTCHRGHSIARSFAWSRLGGDGYLANGDSRPRVTGCHRSDPMRTC
jgi:hypothetical protein